MVWFETYPSALQNLLGSLGDVVGQRLGAPIKSKQRFHFVAKVRRNLPAGVIRLARRRGKVGQLLEERYHFLAQESLVCRGMLTK